MKKSLIGDLRDMRRRAMPGPVHAETNTGTYMCSGSLGGPRIRFSGGRRAENQAFVVEAFNRFDQLLDEVIRLQGQRGVIVRMLEQIVSVCRDADYSSFEKSKELADLIDRATAAINTVLAEQLEGA